ncbi:MAG: sialidase family protein [Pseudomonadota bacterium]
MMPFRLILLAIVPCLIASTSQRTVAPTIAMQIENAALPHLAKTDTGHVVLSWVETDSTGSELRFSVLGPNGWSAADTAAEGSDWFINWADFPSVVPLGQSRWMAHWLRKRPGNKYSYDVVVSVSDDAGQNWRSGITPHLDNTPTEHGFVSLFTIEGAAAALWLDGRNTSGHHGHDGGPMTVRAATFDEHGDIDRSYLVDSMVCDCCQTDSAVTAEGPVVVYRNRTAEEIRDIHISRFVDGGWTESQPVSDDRWQIDGCPVNGPAVAAEDQRVATAWYTAANDQPAIRLALSTDNGATFPTTVTVDSTRPLGRVDVAYLNADTIAISWLRQTGAGSADIVLGLFDQEGRALSERIVEETSPLRQSGFPQMVEYGDGLLFAWTELEGSKTRVQVMHLSADNRK